MVYAACADTDDIERAKQESHDKLVAKAGALRHGPVRWKVLGSTGGMAMLMEFDRSDAIRSVGGDAGPGQYDVYLDYLREHPGGVRDIGRLIALAAERHRREIRRVGLHQQTFSGNIARDITDFLGFRECQNTGKADIAAELQRRLGQRTG